MATIQTFRQLALSLPETSEQPHFERTSFRVAKKIFATLDEKSGLACVKLTETDQDVFSAYDRTVIFPVPNKWGKQGWTNIDLKKVRKDMLTDVLTTAYCTVAPKKLAGMVRSDLEE
jgi:predicted DNA-binding protein (MmcQ/YjbR family)